MYPEVYLSLQIPRVQPLFLHAVSSKVARDKLRQAFGFFYASVAHLASLKAQSLAVQVV